MTGISAEPASADRRARLPRLARIGIVLFVVVAVLALALWIASIALRPQYPTPQDITARMTAQAALTGGAQVYATHCAYCHDKGYGPSIAGQNLAPETVQTFVRSGPGPMQAFTPAQVTDGDIAAVTRYLNSLPAKVDAGK